MKAFAIALTYVLFQATVIHIVNVGPKNSEAKALALLEKHGVQAGLEKICQFH